MDSGNLVVLSAENTSESIWQSFDYPGDTWLPQMKISMSQRLISWKKPWDPSPGSFALEMDPNGSDEFVLMWENHTTYWDTGVWNGKYFPKVPDMTSNSIHNYSYFNNGSYKYFTYSYVTRGFLSRFVMDKSGKNSSVHSDGKPMEPDLATAPPSMRRLCCVRALWILQQ
jgi:hypothetical protein